MLFYELSKKTLNKILKLQLFQNLQRLSTALQKNQSNPQTSIVLTPHPTNLNFNYKDQNGNQRRPYIWEEIDHYYNLLAQSNIPESTKVWIGYDMDRHQDEQDNIFAYTFLKNLQSTLVRNKNSENSEKIIEKDDGSIGSTSNMKSLHHHTGCGYSTIIARKESTNENSLYK